MQLNERVQCSFDTADYVVFKVSNSKGRVKPMRNVFLVLAMCFCASAGAQLNAGVATVSITPLEANIPTQLGGYGAREGKPAEGVHDTLYGKVLILERDGRKTALVTLDVCGVPLCVTEESLAKAGIENLTVDQVLMTASHTHTGLEGASLDRRNVANNPYVGIFSEPVLNFVTDRLAQGLRDANKALQPVRAGAGVVKLPGMNRNRRRDEFVDEDLTVLRLDRLNGSPYVVLVNYTAHGTIVSEHEMLASGEWAGAMQRTVQALMGGDVTCMYTNGAEGDISPNGAKGGSRWEMFQDYGLRVGIQAFRLAEKLETKDVKTFDQECIWVDLPPTQAAPDFVKIAGDEYHVTKEQLEALLPVMFPRKAPIYALRVNDFEMVTFPGEAICQLGLALKDALRKAGIAYPCVGGLTTDDTVGYILTADEYRQSGYEVTASFYGEGLGELLLSKAIELGRKVAVKP